MEQSLLSVRRVARKVGLSPWTIRKYISKGRIPVVRIGRRVFIEPQTIDLIIRKGRTAGRAMARHVNF